MPETHIDLADKIDCSRQPAAIDAACTSLSGAHRATPRPAPGPLVNGVEVGLWPHQHDAVEAAVATFGSSGRATVIAACGAGKTRIGGEVAARLVPACGRVLIVVPTLDLIEQTLRSYERDHPAHGIGQTVAVCKSAEVLRAAQSLHGATRVRVVADPAVLATLPSRTGRTTVVCTYQSLGVIRAAHQAHGLGPWDLVIVDEAHRSAGAGKRAWGVIHDDTLIPAARRLYMTATPRLIGEHGAEGVGMDREDVFGPVAYRLSFGDAIARGLLADYRFLILMITDEEIRQLITSVGQQHLASGDRAVSPRALAVQVALLRAAAQYGLDRVVTYHHRVASARAFADTLPAAAALLDPAERPEHLVARHVSGDQHPDARARTLGLLGSPIAGTVVVCNAQVLREGVDLPEVGAVGFIDNRKSAEYIMQAVGRALRTGGRTGKVATILVPVVLGPQQDPYTALETGVFAPVWHTVRALRAHDERLAADLDRQRTRLGRHGRRYSDPDVLPSWMSLTGSPVPPGFAAAISLQMLTETTTTWQENYGRASAYHELNGHLDVRPDQDAALHTWLRNQRSLRQRGELRSERAALLDELGIVWSVADAAWRHALEVARAYRTAHGHLNATRTDVLGQPPVNLGEWFKLQRAAYRAGKLTPDQIGALESLGFLWDPNKEAWERGLAAARFFHAENGHLSPTAEASPYLYNWISHRRTDHAKGALAPERATALEELGIVWRPIDQAWEAGYAAARSYFHAHGDLRVGPGVTVGQPPFRLGQWIERQRARYRDGTIPPEQAVLLNALGIVWSPKLDAWGRGLQAARAYHAAHGHLRVHSSQDAYLHRWLNDQRESHAHGRLSRTRVAALAALGMSWRPIEDEWNRVYALAADYRRRAGHLVPGPLETVGDPPVRLSTWLSTQRERRGTTMTGRQQRLLEQIGMTWDLREDAWQRGLTAARTYRAEHGHLRAPHPTTIGDPPYPLSSWLGTARVRYRAGTLPPERVADLEALGIDWNPGRGGARQPTQTASDRPAP